MDTVDPIDALIDDITSLNSVVPSLPSSTREKVETQSGEEDGSYEEEPLVDDLDAMILEIEGKGLRRRKPKTADAQNIGARKNPASRRRDVQSALDGDDLDRILEEIQNTSKEKAKAGMSKLGWGVVNAERKFDLMAPRFVLKDQQVNATLIVTTTSGERALVPRTELEVSLEGSNEAPKLVDNNDGTWTITFTPIDAVGFVHLLINTYGQPQFNWKIEICGHPVAENCSATAKETYKVNQKGEILLYAKDAKNQQLRVGGAKFSLGFAGKGQLNDVGLLDKMDGSYSLTFVPSAVGLYAIYISLDGVDIAGTPVNFEVTL